MTNSEKIAELKEEITRLQGRIEDLEKSEKKSSKWKPKDGEVYWYITEHGHAVYDIWEDDNIDDERYAIGNCFPTEESAEFEVERLKVIAEMKEFSFEQDWNNKYQRKYFLYYNCDGADIEIDFYVSTAYDVIYFNSKEQAQACIDSVGQERIKKYYFRIKED